MNGSAFNVGLSTNQLRGVILHEHRHCRSVKYTYWSVETVRCRRFRTNYYTLGFRFPVILSISNVGKLKTQLPSCWPGKIVEGCPWWLSQNGNIAPWAGNDPAERCLIDGQSITVVDWWSSDLRRQRQLSKTRQQIGHVVMTSGAIIILQTLSYGSKNPLSQILSEGKKVFSVMCIHLFSAYFLSWCQLVSEPLFITSAGGNVWAVDWWRQLHTRHQEIKHEGNAYNIKKNDSVNLTSNGEA